MLRPYRRSVGFAAVFVVLQAVGTISGPAIVRYGIDSGVRADDADALARAGVLFLAAALVAYAAGHGAIRTVASVGESFLQDLRERVFAHQLSLSMEFFDRNRTGTLVSRMTADVEALQELIGQGLTMFIVNSLLLSGAVVVMVAMSWELALGTLVVVPLVVKASIWFRRESNRAYLHLRDRIGSTSTSIQEGLAGVRVVQAFGQEQAFVDRFHDTNEELYRAHMRTERLAAFYFPVIELAQGCSIAVILGLGDGSRPAMRSPSASSPPSCSTCRTCSNRSSSSASSSTSCRHRGLRSTSCTSSSTSGRRSASDPPRSTCRTGRPRAPRRLVRLRRRSARAPRRVAHRGAR